MGVYFNIKCKVVLEDFFLSSLIIEGNLKICVHILVRRGEAEMGRGVDDEVRPSVCVGVDCASSSLKEIAFSGTLLISDRLAGPGGTPWAVIHPHSQPGRAKGKAFLRPPGWGAPRMCQQTAEYLVPCSTQSQFPYQWSAALRCTHGMAILGDPGSTRAPLHRNKAGEPWARRLRTWLPSVLGQGAFQVAQW